MMRLGKTLFMGGACLMMTGAAQAETYRLTQWLPNGEPLSIGYDWLAKELTAVTDGEMTVEYFGNASLVPPKATLQAISDGVAHFGFAYSGYTPSENPVTEAIVGFSFAELPFNTLAAAYADFVTNDPDAYGEWMGHGVVPVGGWETPKYDLLCNTPPLRTLADLEGRKIRASGGVMSTFIQSLGATPVNIPSSEAYQAQQTGQAECSNLRPSSLIDIPLMDVTTSVTRLETGMTFASPLMVLNKGMWQGLTPEQRRLFLDLTARMMAKQQVLYLKGHEEALTKAAAAGVEIVEPDDEVKKKAAEWVAAYGPVAVETARTTHGIQDPEDLFARFQVYIDKWEPIIAAVKDPSDEEELTAVFKEHLFDAIDVESYGMN